MMTENVNLVLPPLPPHYKPGPTTNGSLSRDVSKSSVGVSTTYGSPRRGKHLKKHPASSFHPAYGPGGVRFAETPSEKDLRLNPGPGAYNEHSSVGPHNRMDPTHTSHRESGFGALLARSENEEAARRSVAHLFKQMQAHKTAVPTLASMWDVQRDGRVGRGELWRGLASLGLPLSETDLDVLYELCGINGEGGVNLRELSDAVSRSGLISLVPPDQPLDDSVDRVIMLAKPRSGTHGRSAHVDGGVHGRVGRHGQRRPSDGTLEEEEEEESVIKLPGLPKKKKGKASHSSSSRETKKLRKTVKSVTGGITIITIAREDLTKPVREQLRNALSRSAARVIDLFREWDTTPDGELTYKEFTEGIKRLGMKMDEGTMESLFKEWDIDGSGTISLLELNRILRRGGWIPEHLRFDAMEHAKRQEEETKKKAAKLARRLSRTITRKAAKSGNGPALNNPQEKLLKRLAKQKQKLNEIFNSWDKDKDGYVSREELHKSLPLIGVVTEKPIVDALFDTMDHERTERIPVSHLASCLRWVSRSKESSVIKLPSKSLEGKDASEVPVEDLIREALSMNAARVIDLFREFDANGDGEISIDEMGKALPMLGISVNKEQTKATFDAFDIDGDGSVTFREFNKLLRRDLRKEEEAKKKKVVEVAKVEIVSLPQLKQQMKRECSKLQPIPARED